MIENAKLESELSDSWFNLYDLKGKVANIEKYKRQHCVLPSIPEAIVRTVYLGVGGLDKVYLLPQKVPMAKQSLIPPNINPG